MTSTTLAATAAVPAGVATFRAVAEAADLAASVARLVPALPAGASGLGVLALPTVPLGPSVASRPLVDPLTEWATSMVEAAPGRVARAARSYLRGMGIAHLDPTRALLLAWLDEMAARDADAGAQAAPPRHPDSDPYWLSSSDHQPDRGPSHPCTTTRTLVAAPGAPSPAGHMAAAA